MLEQAQWGMLTGWWRGMGRWLPAAVEQASDEPRRTYSRVVLDVLGRCDELHQQWLEQAEEQRRHERLANAAAVYHWRLHALRERLCEVEVPAPLRGWHRVLMASLDAAFQGTRLISSGYRFSHVRRICEGELLLEDARAQGAAVRELLAAKPDPTPAR